VKLLLFDIDQTLINSGGAGLRALDRACHKILAIENAMHGISPHGKTDPAIIREVLQTRLGSEAVYEDRIATLLEAYLSFLREEVPTSPGYRVLPGIAEVLDELSARSDTALGLATGNLELGARIKLERGRLNGYFAFGGFGSDAESRTALVQKAAQAASYKLGRSFHPADIFVIGDTPRDIDAGRDAGFKTIGVGTGSYTVGQLLTAGADLAIPDFLQGREQFLRNTFLD
jgi:phosphoglycolate phosphatase-like HAD superfamily hydrolase